MVPFTGTRTVLECRERTLRNELARYVAPVSAQTWRPLDLSGWPEGAVEALPRFEGLGADDAGEEGEPDIGSPIELLEFLRLYQPDTPPVLHRAVQEWGFSHVRRSKGDGNCFYRAIVFSMLWLSLSESATVRRAAQRLRACFLGSGFEMHRNARAALLHEMVSAGSPIGRQSLAFGQALFAAAGTRSRIVMNLGWLWISMAESIPWNSEVKAGQRRLLSWVGQSRVVCILTSYTQSRRRECGG